jgi:hypothetical protein
METVAPPSPNLLTASKRKPKKVVNDSMRFYRLEGHFTVTFE